MQKLLFLSLLCLPLATVCADSIELQDGTKVEGKILSVSPDTVLLEIQTSPTIREEKSYPRADVAKIQRAAQDDIAFEEIALISAPSTADDPAVYEGLIGPVRSFMKNYGYSKHMPEARKLAASLESEIARLSAGEVKVDGEWIAANATPSDRTELGGRVQLSKMKAASDPVAALAVFEVLEEKYSTSSSYPEGVTLALASIKKLRPDLARVRADVDRRAREQQAGIKLASADRRLQMETAIAQEKAAVEAQVASVKQSGGKWLPLLPDEKVLDDVSRLADSEEARLSKINTAKLSDAVEAAHTAKQQLESGDLKAASASLAEAQKYWSQYVLLASLRDSLRKSEQEAARKAKEAKKPAAP